MEKLKTVKEVCRLTGLTGKHLYYFHHEKVVRATAYANYSVEGNDGCLTLRRFEPRHPDRSNEPT